MRRVLTRTLTAGAVCVGALAWASPAMANCDRTVPVTPRTIGLFGEPVLTTPFVGIGFCGSTDLPSTASVPTVRLETFTQGRALFLDGPSDPAGINWVVGVNVDGTYREVVIPASTGADGQSTCLFYEGPNVNNPGGCVFFIER